MKQNPTLGAKTSKNMIWDEDLQEWVNQTKSTVSSSSMADGTDITRGAIADAAVAAGAAGSISAKLRRLSTDLDAILTKFDVALSTRLKAADTLAGVTAVGSITSAVDISDKAARDLGGVDIVAALPAGSNIIGNVRIDQTTPATTNGVAAKFIDESGAAYGVKHIQNKPRVSAMPYTFDIAEKAVTGHTSWAKIGFHAAVTNLQDVRPYAAATAGIGWTYTFPTAELTMTIVSDSAKDCQRALTAFADSANHPGVNTLVTCAAHGLADGDIVIISGTTSYNGTWTIEHTVAGAFEIVKAYVANDATGIVRGPGANTVTVYYLDDDFVEKTKVCTMLGTTAVTIGTDCYRINNMRVSTAGTTKTPVGTLVFASGGQQYGGISAGRTRARQMVYTVPTLKNLFITDIYFAVASQASGKYTRFTVMANYDDKSDTVLERGLFMPLKEVVLSNSPYERVLTMPIYLPATTDMTVRAFADSTAVITCGLTGWLETP